jgi:ribosomal protein L29
MKAKEIRDLSVAEINVKLNETREKLLALRLRKQTGQVEKTHELRALRKDIARLETIKTQKAAA